MDNLHFKNEMRRIYANHGRTPSDTVIFAVWKRVEDFSDTFMTWAADKMCDYEKLPGNIGLELVRMLYPAWSSETGQPAKARHCCPDCDSQIPGFFYVWRREENGTLYSGIARCMCNDDSEYAFMPMKSKAQVTREGGIVMPIRYDGGPAAFEMREFRRGEQALESGIGDEARRLAASPSLPDTQRWQHAEQLEYAEIF